MTKGCTILFALLMFLPHSFVFATDECNEKQYMREYGLAYCLANFHQTEPSNDIKASLNIYFENMIAGYDSYEELVEYIVQYMNNHLVYIKPNEENPKPNEPVYFFSCLRMYESQDYHSEVERIVKKYCKECE